MLFSQTTRFTGALPEPFVSQYRELILLISKRETVILLISCLQSRQFNNEDKEKASERGWSDMEEESHYEALFG